MHTANSVVIAGGGWWVEVAEGTGRINGNEKNRIKEKPSIISKVQTNRPTKLFLLINERELCFSVAI